MTDQLEQSLRAVLSEHAAQLDPDSIARLCAIDYHPRRRRITKAPAIGAAGAGGIAVAVAAILTLGSGTAPAFAGWKPVPTAPTRGQLAQAAQACGEDLGSPVLSDSRGPYTASIYANTTTTEVCLSGNGASMSSTSTSGSPASVAAGQIELDGTGTRDAAGNALTLVDGRTGAGVTGVTIERSDGTSVQATVSNGWYLAWWPGSVSATSAQITTSSGTSTEPFPSTPALSAPGCPAGVSCASGYSFGSGTGTGTGSVTGSGSAATGRSSAHTRQLSR